MKPASAIAVAAFLLAVAPAARAGQTSPPRRSCAVTGTITASGRPLPGVVVTLTTTDGVPVDTSSTTPDGAFTVRAPAAGEFLLKTDLLAFAPASRTVSLDQASCREQVNLVLTLASRAARAGSAAPAAAAGSRPAPSRRGAAALSGRAQTFQSLAVVADDAAGDAVGGEADTSAPSLALPAGFTPDTSSESIASFGSAQSAETLGEGGREFFRGDGGPGGIGGGFGGPGGFGAAGGRDVVMIGGGGGFGGPFAGRLRNNQIRGALFQNFDTSRFDAAPFSLNAQAPQKADYLQQRFGATIGGPLTIPKLVNSPRTFFFVNYTGNHSRQPFDAWSTVPTAAERAGDLSAIGSPLVDPQTHQPFAGGAIPSSRIDPSAHALLTLFPLPNGPGTKNNFHLVDTTDANVDDVNVRVVHNFGNVPQAGNRRGAGAAIGRGAAAARANGARSLTIGLHYRRSDTAVPNPFPSLGGASTLRAWDVPASFTFTAARLVNTVRVQFNRQDAQTQNAFAFAQNVAAAAGLAGASADPFDWGAPNLSFAGLSGLTDVTPSLRTNQTIAIGDQMIKATGRHVVRWGGDYRDIRLDSRSDPNARGSFVFSGVYTGSAFGDFLLGLPQQATVQNGAGLERFSQRSWDVYLQDDWRARDTLTINAGVRYEYVSPFVEAQGRLVNLDVAPDFTAAVPVAAGQTAAFTGATPLSIVRPDRNNVAPRVGIAWRPKAGTVVRAGYGVNYSTAIYQTIVQQLANQPPFAFTNTVLATPAAPVPLDTALALAPADATTNSYGVDPNYRAGAVQIWNVDLQRDLTRTLNVSAGYTGTKGTDLDLLRAPNRGPSGLLIAGVAPFVWESSGAHSLMNALTVRARKRLSHGVAAGVTYTLSTSMDDASSIGGGAAVVAQNDRDLAAEWGLSSFDQRHRLSADFTFELPFGPDRRWANQGTAAALLGGWVVNANAQFASGTPFTARLIGNAADVARGVNGTLRADYDGAPIAIPDPTTLQFFNTAAFSAPAAGTFGTAGRNTIVGPGTSNVNLGVTRNLTLGANRVVSVQLMAANVFNTPQYSAIDTIVNSPTFGQVVAARAPRRITVTTRFRF